VNGLRTLAYRILADRYATPAAAIAAAQLIILDDTLIDVTRAAERAVTYRDTRGLGGLANLPEDALDDLAEVLAPFLEEGGER